MDRAVPAGSVVYRDAPGAGDTVRRGRGARPALFAFGGATVGYALAVLVLLPRGVNPLSATNFIGVGSDPSLFVWAIAWWPHALTHGLNPFITHAVWAPQGLNLTWDTSVPSVALLMWPVTAAAGPITAYNLAMLLAPTLSALAAFGLCRELTGKFWPSLLGGWMFGFGPYEMGQTLGHLHLTFLFTVPLVVWLAVLRWRGRIPKVVYAGVCGLALAFLLGVSIEVLTTFTTLSGAALMLAWLALPTQRRNMYSLAQWTVAAYAVALAITSPFIVYLFVGAGSASGVLHSAAIYSADLVNYVVPTPITWAGGAWSIPISSHFTGNLAENGAYLGVPLLVLAMVFGWGWRRERWAWILLGAIGVTIVGALGPQLHVDGTLIGKLPWTVITKLPLLKNALPVRLAAYTDLGLAILAAVWLASWSRRRWSVAVLVGLVLLVAWWPSELRTTPAKVPYVLQPREVVRLFKPGATLVVLPYGNEGNSMLWQAVDEMGYRMTGGYLSFVPSAFAQSVVVAELYGRVPTRSDFGAQLAAFCRQHRVEAVVMTPGTPSALAASISKLPWRQAAVGDSRILWVPSLAGGG